MVKKIFGTISIILISLVIVLFFRTGAFKSVEITTQPMPKFKIYFKKNIGPYNKIITSLNFIESKMKKAGIDCKKSFAYFLSDPALVDHDKLVSLTGCLYEEDNSALETLPPLEGVEVDTIGGDEFCYIGKYNGSPSLTPMKVYPKLRKRAQKNRKPLKTAALEIYEVTGRDSVTTSVYLCTFSE